MDGCYLIKYSHLIEGFTRREIVWNLAKFWKTYDISLQNSYQQVTETRRKYKKDDLAKGRQVK